VRVWERPSVQLAGVFGLLGLLAWWTFQVVSVPPSLRTLFDEDEAIATAAIPPTEEEQFQKELARLPAPPENHAPEVVALISRLGKLTPPPAIVARAVLRDRQTPKDQTPFGWSEPELAALQNYQTRLREAWEPFFLGPAPDWKRFPDSALLFRTDLFFLMGSRSDLIRYLTYQPGQPASWEYQPGDDPVFFLRLFQQVASLGTLRFGSLSGWAMSDVVSRITWTEKVLQDVGFFFVADGEDPKGWLALVPAPPTVSSLREGLQADRAVFARSAEYLQSLPAGTPATVALTRLLGDKTDAEWFIRHVNQPKTAQDLAGILREGAGQIGTLEQKTYLSGPAWRQWLAGNPSSGLSPALQGALGGMQEFEEKTLAYQVALAFVRASSAYRQSGVDGMKNIPDPARPGSFLSITTSTNGITLSSSLQKKGGGNYSFTFEPLPSP